MCRWGCAENNLMYKCKYCGTNYCKACKHGDFHGEMLVETTCRVCNQPRCQGERIIIAARPPQDGKSDTTQPKLPKKPTMSGSKQALKKKKP